MTNATVVKNIVYRTRGVTHWRHYFNDILYSRLPFHIGWTLFISLVLFVLHLKNVMGYNATFMTNHAGNILFITFLVTIWWMCCWFDDLIFESVVDSRYVRKIRAALVCGFTPFLVSEIMLFGGFFWAYFDRVYNPGYSTAVCLPRAMEYVDYRGLPLVGTIVSVTSGYYANHAYYLAKAGEYVTFQWFAFCTFILAVLSPTIQLIEYNGLSFDISDNVFCPFFYPLTGFHGFHVTVGLIFLCTQYSRLWALDADDEGDQWFDNDREYIFSRDRHLGLAFSLVYWHFVDVIWPFLFFNLYVYNTGISADIYSLEIGTIMVTSDEYKQLFAFKRMNLFNRMYMILNIESYDAYDKWSWYYRAIVRNNNSKLFLLLGIR